MTKDKPTIAIGGVGAPLGQSIMRAALASKRDYTLIGMDLEPEACHIFPEVPFYQAAHFRSDDYLERYATFLEEKEVDLVFVGSEGEMLFLCDHREDLENRTGARFAMSSPEALHIGMDKLNTVELLDKAGLDYPRTRLLAGDWNAALDFAQDVGFPCIVKSRRAGPLHLPRNEEDLRYLFSSYKDAVIQEFLGNEESLEYTVGLFCTEENGPVATYTMRRILKYGLTWRGIYEPNPEVEAVAQAAARALAPLGSVNVQLREHNGRFVVHEFNVRCSSTAVFRAISGWNEIDMAVDYFMHGQEPEPPGPITPGQAVRYFQERWVPDVG